MACGGIPALAPSHAPHTRQNSAVLAGTLHQVRSAADSITLDLSPYYRLTAAVTLRYSLPYHGLLSTSPHLVSLPSAVPSWPSCQLRGLTPLFCPCESTSQARNTCLTVLLAVFSVAAAQLAIASRGGHYLAQTSP